jgi:capsid protein
MGTRTWTFVPARGAETGSWRVLHVYRMLRAGQVRGVPLLARD